MTEGDSPNIVTIMQTRRGSSRLPDKVLLPILGRPLFLRQLERMQAASLTGTIVVATTSGKEDDLIEEICRREEIPCFRGHSTDLLERHYQAARSYKADVVIKIPSDCPLIDHRIIDRVIGYFLQNRQELDFVSNLHPATWPDGNDVEVMHFGVLEAAWANAGRDFEREHTTPYIWERPESFRIGNIIMENGADHSLRDRWTIDYPEDYEFIRQVYNELYPSYKLFGADEILRLSQEREDIYALNRHLAGVNWYRHHLDELRTVNHLQTKLTD